MHYRCIARHRREGGSTQAITEADLKDYFKYSDATEYGACSVDIAVGSRVRCTHNLATELGK